jgi:hypothetical protein
MLLYQIASQTTYQSWGYMISQGATTTWELWNGNTADPAMISMNHLMLLGSFCTWLYEDLAGIVRPTRPWIQTHRCSSENIQGSDVCQSIPQFAVWDDRD